MDLSAATQFFPADRQTVEGAGMEHSVGMSPAVVALLDDPSDLIWRLREERLVAALAEYRTQARGAPCFEFQASSDHEPTLIQVVRGATQELLMLPGERVESY